eukprot:3929351-Alexandrium_andersonii.AAC.1
MLFSDLDNRWLTPKELLAFQGWPVFGLQKVCDEKTPFDHDNPARTRVSVAEQAGNAMHCHVVGLALLFALSLIHI